MNEYKLEYPNYQDTVIEEPVFTQVQKRLLLISTIIYSFFAWWLALSITIILFVRYTFKIFRSKWTPRVLKVLFLLLALVGQLVVMDMIFGSLSWSITYVLPIVVNMTSLIMIVYALSSGKHWKPLIPIQFFNFWIVVFLVFTSHTKIMGLIYSAIIMMVLCYLTSIIFYGRLFINEVKKYLHL
ncbi:hypothetical protein EZV73_02835 [Acidaminobacter sp. JC074]|uniref:DUF6320 domain-containing protein n=1 Tax=Acidaminobacter sp. JC074 TaxID=2530199 RepID=UPI001F111950|nr:DUF6320 domain-containing protein [Acidaminobacter sp. JC074]MCH4886483.1 hypothetical protein [Acidaminobacter sp. JC074]